MADPYTNILNPIGAVAAHARSADTSAKRKNAERKVVGLLNNSKPNVAPFLDTIATELRRGGYDVVDVTKPRSAGPAPDVDALARDCDFVVNAVAD